MSMKILIAYDAELFLKFKELGFDEAYSFDNFFDKRILENLQEDMELLIISKLFCGLDSNLARIAETFSKQNVKAKINVVVVYDNKSDFRMIDEYFDEVRLKTGLKMRRVSEISQAELCDENCLAKKVQKIKDLLIGNQKMPETKDGVVKIYTDGACSGNPGAGGWAAVLFYGKKDKKLSGFEAETTNNRMELMAVIKGLSALKKKCVVEVFSDSAYVVNAIKNGWLENWKFNGWRGADKKIIKNQELWQQLGELLCEHEVTFFKVKGHSTDEFNNLCDSLATGEIAKNVNKE